MATRPSWDEYFMGIARLAALRGTCDRKQVGCVIVMSKRVVATGYNGALPGLPHCDKVGHDLVESMTSEGKLEPNCVRTIHAEANAIVQAAATNGGIKNATAYVTAYPCWPCFRLLAAAGVVRIVYADAYRDDPRVRAASLALAMMRVESLEKPGG